MPDERLTMTAAGRLIGLSRQAIKKAIDAGRLVVFTDGLVCRESVLRYATARRAPRGGAHRNHPSRQPQPQPAPVSSNPDDDAQPCVDSSGICRVAWAYALIIRAGATELPPILLRYLPESAVRETIEAWTATMRREIVGAMGVEFEPVCVTEGWPTPPGGGEWRDHALFTEAAADDVNWPESASMADAWRAEHGRGSL